MNRGIWYAIGAYGTWGLLPIYWKLLKSVPAVQLVSHRIVWSLVMLVIIIAASGQWQSFLQQIRRPGVVRVYLLAAILIGANWLIYIWGVIAGFIVETSLGYYINPLLSVLIGVAFFRERLRRWQWGSIAIAAGGVLYLTFIYGSPPWIALSLAVSFGAYGALKKMAPLNSLHGLTLETGLLLAPALGFLLWSEAANLGAFLHQGVALDLLTVGAGLMTTVPLLLFASAAQRIPLSLVGVLQYIAPTMQFLLGVLVYREPFDSQQFMGFAIVWLALAIFAVEGFRARRAPTVSGAAH